MVQITKQWRLILFVFFFVFSLYGCASTLLHNMILSQADRYHLQYAHKVIKGQNYYYYYSKNRNKNDPTIVFIHGFASQKESWFGSINTFNKAHKHYNYVAMDLLGFGENSRNYQQFYGLKAQAAYVHQLLEYLNIKHGVMIGISLGAGVAASYAALYPHELSKLVLIDAMGDDSQLESQFYKAIRLTHYLDAPLDMATRSSFLDVMSLIYAKAHFLPAFAYILATDQTTTFSYLYRKILLDIVNDGGMYPLNNTFSKIKVPTLILWGADDQLFDVSAGVDIQQKIPHSQLKIFPDAGHASIAPGEAGPAINQAIMQFIK